MCYYRSQRGRLITNELRMNSIQQKRHQPVPTRSLREYLARQSTLHSQSEEEHPPAGLEVEVDIGDGRMEVLVVDSTTDIEHQARQFCQRHGLQSFVGDLLAESIHEQYQREVTEDQHQRSAQMVEGLREISLGRSVKEVLLDQLQQLPAAEEATQTYESSQKGSMWRQSQGTQAETGNRESQVCSNKENQPCINAVSRLICSKYGKENIIKGRQRRSQEKMATIRREVQQKQEEELKECNFHPKVNLISQKVDQEMGDHSLRQHKRVERYELLYSNYLHLETKRNSRQEHALDQLSFKPHMNPISKRIMQGKQTREDNIPCKTTVAFGQAHQQCGQPTAKSRPKTGRKPENRNRAGLPIGDYLYLQARRQSKPELEKNDFKALQHSDFLVAELKAKKLKQTFGWLTRPPHQILQPSDVPPTDQLLGGPLRLLAPLLLEIIELGVSLSEPNFVQAGLQLLDSLSPNDRHEFLFKKAPQNASGKNTSSNVSYNSLQSRGISRQDSGNLYARGMEQTRMKRTRLERSREGLVRQELSKCTFQPLLH